MYETLQDLIATCPQQLEANTVIVFDGCHRVLQAFPDDYMGCPDYLQCITCEFMFDLITFDDGLITDPRDCSVSVNMQYIDSNITASFSCVPGVSADLVIWTNTFDMTCIADFFSFTFQDGLNNYAVANGDLIFTEGLDWLRFIVWANTLQIGLPTGGTNWQVLTWNSTNSAAERANVSDLQCNEVMACMQPITDMLQNQINIIAGQLCPCNNGAETITFWVVCPEGTIMSLRIGQFYVYVPLDTNDPLRGALYYNPSSQTNVGWRLVLATPATCGQPN